jgi:hypothetical protein
MFRALLAHLQEALHKQHLVYGVRIISVGCTSSWKDYVKITDVLNIKLCQLYKTKFYEAR